MIQSLKCILLSLIGEYLPLVSDGSWALGFDVPWIFSALLFIILVWGVWKLLCKFLEVIL